MMNLQKLTVIANSWLQVSDKSAAIYRKLQLYIEMYYKKSKYHRSSYSIDEKTT